jgi:uncharacterized protein YpmS
MRVQKKTSKKSLIITLSVIVVLATGAGAYALLSHGSSSEPTASEDNQSKSLEDSNSSSESTSINTDSSSTIHESEKDIQPSYEGEDTNNSISLTGVVNYKSVINDSLLLRTTINQILNSGTCDLTLSNGQKTVTRSSSIVQNPSSSSCEGFDIPISELGSGTWSIEIKLTGEEKTGILTDSVSL